ncbi:MAG TPA: hypothetical protein P5279_17595 [Anaerohalosphaeraceae bacterium]|jgi:hypothetical protein|nr:hypothetical protein [Anaerohalosphaeraceae bacterium]HRT52307.1 hypothetical protein [Anaerohalosphaeraceae bacterium]
MVNGNSRYQGKSLLRLLECYVLWAIDQLPAAEAKTLKEITPKLQSIYGVQGDWRQIIAAVMKLPSGMPETIRRVWVQNVEIARRNNATLTPQQFAEMFVDQNLVT